MKHRKSAPQLDVSAPMIGADQVWNTHCITGQDVIVGVLDSGIDWQHPAFCREDGRTRIRCMLDLSETGNYYGGRLYDETDINTALQTGSGVWESDYSGHGTHVAGIIAGNGRSDANGGVYTGVAHRKQNWWWLKRRAMTWEQNSAPLIKSLDSLLSTALRLLSAVLCGQSQHRRTLRCP